ncbi:hypothetical protein HN51_035487 [Arachis hypogaea]
MKGEELLFLQEFGDFGAKETNRSSTPLMNVMNAKVALNAKTISEQCNLNNLRSLYQIQNQGRIWNSTPSIGILYLLGNGFKTVICETDSIHVFLSAKPACFRHKLRHQFGGYDPRELKSNIGSSFLYRHQSKI